MITKKPINEKVKVAAAFLAILICVCLAMTLAHNDEVADEALKACENARYSLNNPKECNKPKE